MESASKARQELERIEEQIGSLESVAGDNQDARRQLQELHGKVDTLRQQITAQLNAWGKTELARHPQRPYTLDYIERLFTEWTELHGDRGFSDDPAILCGMARFHGEEVAVIGTQKGRDAKKRVYRNFGMPNPEGYRKAVRMYELAERFNLPIFTFVDTMGAYPGLGAEERGQSEAIGASIEVMSRMTVPIITTVIGEGGSGGALAIAVGDALLMLQYSTYSVISPEGCASILWKSAEKAPDAAETLGITATRLKALGLVDKIISEPLGGAHRDYAATMQSVKKALQDALKTAQSKPTVSLIQDRFNRLMSYGKFKEVALQ